MSKLNHFINTALSSALFISVMGAQAMASDQALDSCKDEPFQTVNHPIKNETIDIIELTVPNVVSSPLIGPEEQCSTPAQVLTLVNNPEDQLFTETQALASAPISVSSSWWNPLSWFRRSTVAPEDKSIPQSLPQLDSVSSDEDSSITKRETLEFLKLLNFEQTEKALELFNDKLATSAVFTREDLNVIKNELGMNTSDCSAKQIPESAVLSDLKG